jgi:hypothetical protein
MFPPDFYAPQTVAVIRTSRINCKVFESRVCHRKLQFDSGAQLNLAEYSKVSPIAS